MLLPAITLGLMLQQPKPLTAAEIYRRFKGAVVTVTTPSSSGTGFVIGDDPRLIVTAYHVIADEPDAVRVDRTGNDKVRVVGFDETRDVALLEISKPIATAIELKELAPPPPPGTKIYVISNPLGFLDSTLSDGIVSGLRKSGNQRRLQFTASISHGSSGAPVMDERGLVVGMVASTIEEGQSLNFAVLADDIAKAVLSAEVSDNALLNRVLRNRGTHYLNKPGSGSSKEVLVGFFGYHSSKVDLFSSPSKASKVAYTAKKSENLIVLPQKSGWFKVFMPRTGKTYFAKPSSIELIREIRYIKYVP